MELTKVQEKIKKESRNALIIATIFGYFSAALFGFMLLIVILTAIWPGPLHPSPETAFADIVSRLAPFMFNCAFVAIVSFFASKIFYDINKSCTPFSEKNTKRLRLIAGSMSFMAIALALYSFICFTTSFGGTGGEFQFAVAFVTTYVTMSVIFGFLAYIFDYGRLLQQESDETL